MNSSNADLSAFNGVEQNGALQTQEEQEATEDIRRRQEELQVLIKNVLDEYDYEESTTYSTTNVSVEETPEVKHNIFEDSQIHTLYQARVEEVVNLKQELQLLRARLDEERQINANREALAESELQKCKISMQQAQELLLQKNVDLAQLQAQLQQANEDLQQLQGDLKGLKDENFLLRANNESLNDKVLQLENDNISTNKITERELQIQYLDQISILERQLDAWQRCAEQMEENNTSAVQELESKVREQMDKLAEQKKLIEKLEYNLADVRTQSNLYENMFERTKLEFNRYKDENKAGNQLLELVKAGKLGNFTDVSSAINAMKQQLQDDDQEIPTTKKRKTPDFGDSPIQSGSSTVKTDDSTGYASSSRRSQSSEDGQVEQLNGKVNELTLLVEAKNNELQTAFENTKSLNRELKRSKDMCSKMVNRNERLNLLVCKLQIDKRQFMEDREILRYRLMENESDIAELREKVMLEHDCTENAAFLLYQTNNCLEEIGRQLGEIGQKARQAREFLQAREDSKRNVEIQTDEGPLALQRELLLREQLQEDFKKKLDNIETKYKKATTEKFNCDNLKQQVLRLTAKLHKYKSLYDTSRRAMMDYLSVSSEQVKLLQKQILDIDQQKTMNKEQVEIYKQELRATKAKLEKSMAFTDGLIASWKQLVDVCGNVNAIGDRVKEIANNGQQQIQEIESQYLLREREIKKE